MAVFIGQGWHLAFSRMQRVNQHARPSIIQVGCPTCCYQVYALDHAIVGTADLDYIAIVTILSATIFRKSFVCLHFPKKLCLPAVSEKALFACCTTGNHAWYYWNIYCHSDSKIHTNLTRSNVFLSVGFRLFSMIYHGRCYMKDIQESICVFFIFLGY